MITNKGTEEHPIAKARLVAREFNTGDKRGEFVCRNTRFDGDANSDSRAIGWRDEINHAARCQDSFSVWRRKEAAVR